MTIPQLPPEAEQEYYRKISKIESGDNPKAKARTSSASGRFQFIKSTWEGLGYDRDDVFNDKLQYEAIEKFTRQNAEALIKAGCAINHATLYGAHFLGTAGFLKVMRGIPSASITTVTTAAQRKANPTILKGTIADFTDWLKRKTGDDYRTRYTISLVTTQPPEPPIIVHDDNEPIIPGNQRKNAFVGFIVLLVIVFFIVAYIVLN